MQLLLHIGPHKTGSSSIQRALEVGRGTLRENGVLYVWYKCTRQDCSGQWLEKVEG